MASTAQDPSAPLRAEKKDEDRDEDSARPDRAPARPGLRVDDQSQGPGLALRRVRSICMHPLCIAAEARCACAAVEYSPFYGIEKGAVLQEARIFNDPHIDPRRCQQVCSRPCAAGTRAVPMLGRAL